MQFARTAGVNGGILPLPPRFSNRLLLSSSGTVLGGQFDWGGRLPKGNGGAQRYPQHGWKSCLECNGIRVLDCETYRSNR